MPTTVAPSVRAVLHDQITYNRVDKTISFTTPEETAETDLIVCFQNVDWGSLDQGPGPNPGGWSQRAVSNWDDGGSVSPATTPYTRVWTAVAGQDGAQTYSISIFDERADHQIIVLVVSGANVDDPIDFVDVWSAADATSHVAVESHDSANNFSADTAEPNELICVAYGAGQFDDDQGDYTLDARLTKQFELDVNVSGGFNYCTMAVGTMVQETAGNVQPFFSTYTRSASPTTAVNYTSICMAIKPAKTTADPAAITSTLGVNNTVTVKKKVHAQVTSSVAVGNDPTQAKAVSLAVSNELAVNDRPGSVKDVLSVPSGGPIDLSLWAINDDGSYAGPLPDSVSIDVSPVVNEAGSVRITYPRSGHNFDLLHDPVIDDRDREVAIWVGGREHGSMRAVLNEASGDEVGEEAVWTFTGTMLNGRMAEAIVYPNADDEKQETHFDAATAGTVMATLMGQAQDRGALTDIDFGTFNDVTGSNGTPFSKVITMVLSPGTKYLAVLGTLVEYGLCDWEVTSDHRLKLYEPGSRGKDLTLKNPPVVLRAGKDLTDSPRQHSVKDSVTALLAAGKDGLYHEEDDDDAETRRGRRIESYVSQGNIDDEGSLTAYAQAALTAKTSGVMALSQGLTMVQGNPLPIADFDLFDYLYSDNGNGLERFRVSQWTISQDKNGKQTGAVALNDLAAEYAVALSKRLAAMESGSAVVGTSNPAPDGPDVLAPAAPTGVVGSALAYLDTSTGNTYAAVTAGWDAVTTNADGTAAFDIAGYRARYRYTGLQQVGGDPPPEDWGPISGSGTGAWTDLGDTNASTTHVFFSGLSPDMTIEIQVQAFDRAGNVSEWSEGFVMTTANDTTAPPSASVPTVTQSMGVVKVVWDGLDNLGVAMPPDFSYAEVHISTSRNFTPSEDTYKDKLFGASSTALNGFLYGVALYVKLVAVDLSGNKASGSVEATVTPQPIFSDDIFDGAVGSEALAALAVKEANIDTLAVSSAKVQSIEAGQITSGVGMFDMLLAGRIRTADSGARIEMDNFSFRQYGIDEMLHTEFRANDGSALITGLLRSALTGKRWEMQPDGTLRLYPAAGANFASIANNVNSAGGQEIVLRGQLTEDDNQYSGYLRASSQGIAVQYGTPGYAQVLAQLSVKKSNIDMTAPVNGLRVDQRFATADGTDHRNVLVFNDTNGDDIAESVFHHLIWDVSGTAWFAAGRNSMIIFDNGESGGHGGDKDAIWFTYGNGSDLADIHCGLVNGSVVPTSGIESKEDITDISYEVLDLIRAVQAKEWTYKPEAHQRPGEPQERKLPLRRRRPGAPKDSNLDEHFEYVVEEPKRRAGKARKAPRHIGPIAEDILAIAPDMVNTDYKIPGLYLQDMVGVLWAAVGELADKIDALVDKSPDVGHLPGRRNKPPKGK